ncbi:MAG: 16S rRNA (adenine(1518)-N(6)/adenine(1519)-N(6))-dimethyltransferase RsmA [Armatimonadota bacterium]|nr:16S rRNA (adenine(1518)-N(6)/adenine(1519)-N(6))-dimethyltransferase RsmA [Armatimonadota bacterium]
MPTTTPYDPATSTATRALLREIGATPNRTLGQNFLINGGALDRIVATAEVSSDDHVLEIGPGLGALTCRLVRHASHVVAVEKDRQFMDLLHRHLPVDNFRLVPGDALQLAWDELGLPEQGVKVVANLPYSISKPMLRRLMEEWRPHLVSATLTVQREVAERIVATPGTATYGPMALMAQLYGMARRVFDISPGSFLPPPEVVSSVVHIVMRPTPAVALADERYFWRVVNAAFAQRRKQLGNTLRAIIPDKDVLLNILRELNIDPQRRGETLSLQEFARLSEQLAAPRLRDESAPEAENS